MAGNGKQTIGAVNAVKYSKNDFIEILHFLDTKGITITAPNPLPSRKAAEIGGKVLELIQKGNHSSLDIEVMRNYLNDNRADIEKTSRLYYTIIDRTLTALEGGGL